MCPSNPPTLLLRATMASKTGAKAAGGDDAKAKWCTVDVTMFEAARSSHGTDDDIILLHPSAALNTGADATSAVVSDAAAITPEALCLETNISATTAGYKETAPERQTATAAAAGPLHAPDDCEKIEEKLATALEIARAFAADNDPATLLVAGGHIPFRMQRKVIEGENVFLVKDGVYLGSEYGAADIALLRGLGISRVINITAGSRRVPNFGTAVPEWGDVEYMNFELNDYIGADPSTAIGESVASLRKWASEQPPRKCLVHCSAGLSRSVTVVLAWLMHAHGMSLHDAVATVTQSRGRPPACNASFWAHLAALERDLFALPSDASPSYNFTEHVVDDLGSSLTGLGLDDAEVRRLLPLRQWDGYRVMTELLGTER